MNCLKFVRVKINTEAAKEEFCKKAVHNTGAKILGKYL